MTRRTRSEGERGQALVELALVLPFLLLILVGVIEFGRAWNAYQVITDAAREGARRSVIADPGKTEANVEARVRDYIQATGFDPAKATVTFPSGFGPPTGSIRSVHVAYAYQFGLYAPIVRMAFSGSDGSVVLRTEARMREE